MPTRRGRNQLEQASGTMPSFGTNVSTKRAERAIRITSQPSAMPAPPPAATPLIAATVGIGASCSVFTSRSTRSNDARFCSKWQFSIVGALCYCELAIAYPSGDYAEEFGDGVRSYLPAEVSLPAGALHDLAACARAHPDLAARRVLVQVPARCASGYVGGR